MQFAGIAVARPTIMLGRIHVLLGFGVVVALAVAPAGASAGQKAKKKPAPAPVVAEDAPEFDRTAAASALSTVDLTKCKSTNAKRGDGHVMITFTSTGTVSTAIVDKGPMVGTPTAKCIAKVYTKARVPAFKGGPIQVGKNFKFE